MADFLASFNLGNESPAFSNNPACSSAEDLQRHVRRALDAKVTPTRAEHVSTTLELRPQAQLTLTLSASENEAFQGLTGIDPSLGGVRSTNSTDETGQPVRLVRVSESLENQPHDNPVLQKAVAKHIIGTVSSVDECSWIVRDVSRGSQGWSFTYVCKDSLQHWNRQHAKTFSKAIIGDYSLKGPDPVLSNRPAFDCRGSITISFSRTSRSVTVSYEHTSIHKTVGQLTELFQPTPRQLGPGALAQAQRQKSPKKPSLERKKRREAAVVLDDEGNPIPTPKKKRREPAVVLDEDGHPIPKPKKKRREAVVVLDENGNPKPKKKRKKNNGEAQPELAGPSEAENLNGTQYHDAQSQDELNVANLGVTLSVSPEEAARRKEAAITMLKDGGVDPDSLSADQFNIFANQPPQFQSDSLKMLVQYGAERLRIVVPKNNDDSASATPNKTTPSASQVQDTPNGLTTTTGLAPPRGSSNNPRKSNASKITDVDDSSLTPQGTKKETAKGMGKSRVSCLQCKGSRVKCPRERPICSECTSSGQACEYPPQPQRKRKRSETVASADEDEDDDDSDVQPEQQPDTSSYPQMPVANMLTTWGMDNSGSPTETRNIHNHQVTPVPLPIIPQQSPSSRSSNSRPPLPNSRPYGTPQSETTPTLPVPQPQAPPAETIASPKLTKRKSRASAGGSRSRVPDNPRHESPAINTQDAPASGWVPNTGNIANLVTPVSVAPHTLQQQQQEQQQQRSRHQQNQAPVQAPARDSVGPQDGPNRVRTPYQAPLQRQQSPSVTAAMQAQARGSPFQVPDAQRAKSRQGQRRSHTPRTSGSNLQGFNVPAAAPVQPRVSHDPVARQAAVDMTDLAGYRDYGQMENNEETIGYTPFSQQQQQQQQDRERQRPAADSAAYPSYNYARNTPATMPMSNPPSTTAAPSQLHGGTHSDSWMLGQQGRQSGDGSLFNGSSSYGQTNDPLRLPQSSRSSLGALNQRHQQQRYPSYLTQTEAQSQGQHQGQSNPQPQEQQQQGQGGDNPQQDWYGLNTLAEHGPRYNWKMQDMPWTGMS